MKLHPAPVLLALGTLGTTLIYGQVRQSPPGDGLIPPATPLVACDPYFSIWSPGDTLNGVETTHWTGRQHQLTRLQLLATDIRFVEQELPFARAAALNVVAHAIRRVGISGLGGGRSGRAVFGREARDAGKGEEEARKMFRCHS